MKNLLLLLCALFGSWRSGLTQTGGPPPDRPDLPPSLIFDPLAGQDRIPDVYTPGIFQDRTGFIWLANKKGLIRYDGRSLRIFAHDAADTTSLADSFVWPIAEDRAGYLWVPTYDGGLNRYDPRTETFTHFPLQDTTAAGARGLILWSVTVDRQNRLWVGSRGKGLFIVSADRESITHLRHDPADSTSLSSDFVGRVLQDRRGRFWIPTMGGGLNGFDPETGEWRRFPYRNGAASGPISNYLSQVKEDDWGRLWLPSWEGFSMFDPRDTTFTHYRHDPATPDRLADNQISSLSVDDQNRIWLATGRGLNVYYPDRDHFLRFAHDPLDPHSLPHEMVFATYADRSGVRWISTAGGISRWNDRSFSYVSLVRTLPEKRHRNFEGGFKSLLEDRRGGMWASTNNGVYRYDPASDTYRHYRRAPNWRTNDLAEGPDGRIWIAADGLYWVDPATGTLHSFCKAAPAACADLPQEPILTLAFDATGMLWAALETWLLKIDPRSLAVVDIYDSATDAPGGFVYIRDIQIDPKGRLWLAGDGGGLQYFDPSTATFHPARLPEQLPASLAPRGESFLSLDRRGDLWINTPAALLRCTSAATAPTAAALPWKVWPGRFHSDARGRYWLVRPEGLQRFDPDRGPGPLYAPPGPRRVLDGSLLATRSGELYLGGPEGLYRFSPDRARRNTRPPQVVLTDLRLANRRVPIRGSSGDTLDRPSPLLQSITYAEELHLPHDANDFTLEFAALDFHQPEHNRYKYLLDGWQRDTFYTTADRPFATYTNLGPGSYTFRVWGSNNDGVWSETEAAVAIHILAPWYWTGAMKALYFLLGGGLLLLVFRLQLQRRLADAEAQRWQEMDLLKTRLFANITHEFRNPLTVISGMAQQVADDPQQWFRQGLRLIRRNSERLLSLVNQLLTLSRLEAGRLPLQLTKDDIVPFLRYLAETFAVRAAARDIRFHLHLELDRYVLDFDPEKLQTILSNLIDNAGKFTPAGGAIHLRVTEQRALSQEPFLELRVEDTGIGIPADRLPYVFDRFYQTATTASQRSSGTGIGLALTRELVQLLGGTIIAESEEGKGAAFTLRLPVRRRAAPGSARELITPPVVGPTPVPEATADGAVSNDRPLVLLIEDDSDVRFYLMSCLRGLYRLLTAGDGREGIDIASERVPDIVISDVMMPDIDGFEVVKILKADVRTSHIPIVLLTGRADQASRLAGLERGADAYLAKPFHRQELEIRLQELIALRRRLQARFARLEDLGTPLPTGAEEVDFLVRLRRRVEARIDDTEYGIPALCRDLGISRTQLHRKLKALTGQSTSHVIRTIRLQRARELLTHSQLNISEVAYAVGFTNRSHFTTVFTEAFGRSPRAYRRAGESA